MVDLHQVKSIWWANYSTCNHTLPYLDFFFLTCFHTADGSKILQHWDTVYLKKNVVNYEIQTTNTNWLAGCSSNSRKFPVYPCKTIPKFYLVKQNPVVDIRHQQPVTELSLVTLKSVCTTSQNLGHGLPVEVMHAMVAMRLETTCLKGTKVYSPGSSKWPFWVFF